MNGTSSTLGVARWAAPPWYSPKRPPFRRKGRISPQDLGIWREEHVEPLARIARFMREHGAASGIQLAHAGRKASTARPWEGGGPAGPEAGGWSPVLAPSAVPFTDGHQIPHELTVEEIGGLTRAFATAAGRALQAGFEVIEVHGAHGYLLHEFLSPLSNRRTDVYGGSFVGRTRFLREVIAAIRGVWPERLPVLVRISATDWEPDGWDVEQSVELASILKREGVDLIDCSSGGAAPPRAGIPVGPGYQTPLAERIRREAAVPTGAVGMITSPHQADHVIRTGQADLVLLARELLRDPYWPLRAAHELRQEVAWPAQYARARP